MAQPQNPMVHGWYFGGAVGRASTNPKSGTERRWQFESEEKEPK